MGSRITPAVRSHLIKPFHTWKRLQKNIYHSNLRVSKSLKSSHDLRRELALLPYTRSINIKQVRNRNERRSNETQNTARPWYTQIMEHRINKQRESCRKHTPQKGICSDGRGGEFLERVDQVVERGLEDGEEAEAHAYQPDHGRDPGDAFGGRPAENEEPA